MKRLQHIYLALLSKLRHWFRWLVKWRMRNISHRTFLLVLSVFVGFLSGVIAVTIKNSVHIIQSIMVSGYLSEVKRLLYFVLPVIGIAITYSVVRYVLRRSGFEQGVPAVLYSLSKERGLISKFQTYASLITAPFTVAFGGSVGLEAPTLLTGSAIGSNLGKAFHLDFKMRALLIGAAAAGTVSSIFNAPIAGVVFTLEVIMIDMTTASLIPLLVASASASLTSRLFLGDDILFHFPVTRGIHVSDVPFYIGLGVIAGLFSVYFTLIYLGITKLGGKWKNPWLRMAIGGAILGLLLFVFPPLYGEGFELINAIIEGDFRSIFADTLFPDLHKNALPMLLFIAALAVFKAIATSVTVGAGGVGGIFAPTLFMGSTLGFVVASLLNQLGFQVSAINFTMVGMAALMGGIMHAPLTAIFLIAEITNGYSLFVPLMITVSVAFLVSKYLFPHSVYTFKLATRGELLTHHQDRNVLTLMRMDQLLETNLKCVSPEMTLGDLVEVISGVAAGDNVVVNPKHISGSG